MTLRTTRYPKAKTAIAPIKTAAAVNSLQRLALVNSDCSEVINPLIPVAGVIRHNSFTGVRVHPYNNPPETVSQEP